MDIYENHRIAEARRVNHRLLNSQLLNAAYDGNLSKFQEALTAGADPSARDSRGHSVLAQAVSGGNQEIFDQALRLSDPRSVAISGMNALMIAARDGSSHFIPKLLPFCDPLAKNMHGRDALMLASRQGELAALQALLPVSDPLAVDNDGWSALMQAAQEGHLPCVKALFRKSDPLARLPDGRSALDIARARAEDEPHFPERKGIELLLASQQERLALAQATRRPKARAPKPRL